MGKPFKKELTSVVDTYNWAKTVDITTLSSLLDELMLRPTFVVGSGGSLSACHMLSLLQQSQGTFSKAITPLELHYSKSALRNANVFFLSASGRNSDILFAYNDAIKEDPRNVFGLCMRKNTKLAGLSLNHAISKIIEFNTPAGKDGFLATNSLVAYFTILSRMFGDVQQDFSTSLTFEEQKTITEFAKKLNSNFSLITLYAGWSQPVAIDIESKFTEAGLGNILYSDYRNFGHGRHNWFDKKAEHSAIVALVTPEEKLLVKKTLSVLPNYIPKLILSSDFTKSSATIDLLIKSFYLVNAVGENMGIDPGRPGVPEYGSKLYHLRYLSLIDNKSRSHKTVNAILKKTGKQSISKLTKKEIAFWEKCMGEYIEKLNKTEFGAIIFDYDGTLCTKEERKTLPSKEIIDLLHSFLEKGFIVGIVTGRGKSIRETLSKCIDKKYQNNLIIGYYNGACVSSILDGMQPGTNLKAHKNLQTIYNLLLNNEELTEKCILELRPMQLTIERKDKHDWVHLKQIIIERIATLPLGSLQVLESVHSLDIIVRPQVSKLNIIKQCIDECKQKGLSEKFICIGDKGKFPGNDYELLASEFSLSVDEVSADPFTCWNISEVGNRGTSSCLQYLKTVRFHRTFFKLNL